MTRTCVALRRLLAAGTLAAAACAAPARADDAPGASDYRTPSAAVTALLTAAPPPQPLLHAASRRVALLYREPVIALERLTRPRLGLAGFRFDPASGSSGAEPLVTHVEVVAARTPVQAPIVWRPSGGALLDHVRFSPDGRRLSALRIGEGPARLALFELESGRERVLDTPVNAAWGEPCRWIASDSLLCRLHPEPATAPPPARPAPTLVEHQGGPAPVRTYPNLLENGYEDALFEHYFTADVARVALDGSARRVPGLRGLLESVSPSPDAAFAVVRRLERPFPRMVPAERFPSRVELWDLTRGRRLYASGLAGFGVGPAEGDAASSPRRHAWKSGAPTVLGWIETRGEPGVDASERWLALEAKADAHPVEITRSAVPIRGFGWTTAGTPWLLTRNEGDTRVRIHVVADGQLQQLAELVTADRYADPGRALRAEGEDGPVLETDGRIFLAGDGLGPGGPQPFLDAFDLRTRESRRLFQSEPGVFESVLGVLDANGAELVTLRETESEPPQLGWRRGAERVALRPATTPYPQLEGAVRRVLGYRRSDGVSLSGTLYLPPGRREGERLPTLIWIYPYEFDDREHAEQLDLRSFRFHQVKGPSPLAAVVGGYAVLLNPTVPILHERGATNDEYLSQLVASVEAAVDHLVALGVTDPARVAVAGRSYGAFSSANLLIHSKRFASAIAMSGAYNRTLTPFGFQHERRSFWQATELYTQISPFFHADRIQAPLLLVHGGSDENPGTPPLQARRFFHALAGEGKPVRYVELPGEGHHTWARENVLLASAEMLDWLDRTIGAGSQ
jgi:dipeptidyl aminopeptidase/acylaminoacyl peptidase